MAPIRRPISRGSGNPWTSADGTIPSSKVPPPHLHGAPPKGRYPSIWQNTPSGPPKAMPPGDPVLKSRATPPPASGFSHADGKTPTGPPRFPLPTRSPRQTPLPLNPDSLQSLSHGQERTSNCYLGGSPFLLCAHTFHPILSPQAQFRFFPIHLSNHGWSQM